MRRRLTVVIVAVVAAALVVAGLVSLLLAALGQRRQAEREVTQQAVELAADADRLERPAALKAFGRILRLSDVRVVRVGPAGRTADALPDGLSPSDLQPRLLLAGRTVHGHHRKLVFAAAPVSTARVGTGAVVVTRRVGLVPGVAGYFLLSSLVALALAAVVGDQLGRVIARPLVQAEAATRRIAAGDLSASVPVPSGAGPELASLAGSINTMARGLGRLRDLERQFLLSVSHDLRTPLTSIRGFAEAIADGTAPDARRAAGVIVSESRRLERLVGDLLDLAKLDARTFSLDLRSTDAGSVVAETAEGFLPAVERYGLALDVRVTADGPLVRADPDRLAQVVANLVENALKYARASISVRVDPGGPDGREPGATLVVEDDGPGIAPADLPRVFERLYTSSRTPARQVGSGLGLAIVAELVQAMGGTVRAESPLHAEGGTRIAVSLPPASAPRGSD